MKKILSLVMLFTTFCTLSACAGNGSKADNSQQSGNEPSGAATEPRTGENSGTPDGRKVLVAFFSRTGENYAVGNIKKGNTHIVAEMIAAETSADLFEIKPVKAYPVEYRACTDVAKEEKESDARPEIAGDTKVEDYDVIFIGYPNWWGDMPMAVYTFIEKHDWQGKTVVPFCTHEGSGLSDTAASLENSCQGSTVLQGLAVKGSTAQNSQDDAKKAVQSWIKKLNLQ